MTQRQKNPDATKGHFIITNDKGLHTRPSTELVKCAAKFKSKITLTFQHTSVDGKSLLGILALAAARGSKITVEAVGTDSIEAVTALMGLAREKFHTDF